MNIPHRLRQNRILLRNLAKKLFPIEYKRSFELIQQHQLHESKRNLSNRIEREKPLQHQSPHLPSQNVNATDISTQKLFSFQNNWPSDIKNKLIRDMTIMEDFISEAEEERLHAECEKSMKRMRYQYDHWDDAIHGYREMEKGDWLPENESVLNRVRKGAFDAAVLPQVHILDLAPNGIIKPHVDSSRYCGSTIAGLSLLTNCIMRLRRVDEQKYEQTKQNEEVKCMPEASSEKSEMDCEFDYFVDVLLKRRSLYIMKDSARYKFSHEVLPSKSMFCGQEVMKDRRISIICRNQA